MSPAVPVSQLAEQVRGVTYGKSDASSTPRPGFLPVLRAGNITEGGLTFDDLVFVPAERISEKQRIRKNDVVIAASSGSLDVVGKAARALDDYEGGFGAFCKVLRPGPNVDPAYFAHFFRTRQYRQRVSALAAGVNINNLRNEHLDDMQIPLPPLPEQRRIAEILDQADALRAKRRAALAQLATLTQSIFLDMFGDPATNPKGWPEVPLGLHASKIGSGATPLGGEVAYKSAGIALIRSMNVRDGSFLRDGLAFIDDQQAARLDGVVVEGDDVLLNITGASVARICRAPRDVLPARVNQHVAIVRPTRTFDSRFLEQCLLYPSMKRELRRLAGAGATREAITKDTIERLTVIRPPRETQDAFANLVRLREGLEVVQGSHLNAVDALLSSLQHRAFCGELLRSGTA